MSDNEGQESKPTEMVPLRKRVWIKIKRYAKLYYKKMPWLLWWLWRFIKDFIDE